MANWSELPRESLGLVLDRLFFSSLFAFKSVCSSWSSVVQETKSLPLSLHPQYSPWLMQGHVVNEQEQEQERVMVDDTYNCFFSLADQKFFYSVNSVVKNKIRYATCVGSSHGWLAFIDPNCLVFLLNPFNSSNHIIPLPPTETLPGVVSVTHKSNNDVEYFCSNSYCEFTASAKDLSRQLFHKLVLSSPPPPSPSPANDNNNYTVMAIQGNDYQLAFCKYGDTKWTTLQRDGPHPGAYEELLYSNTDQLFYTLNYRVGLEAWDLRDSSSPKHTNFRIPLPPRFCFPQEMSEYEEWLRCYCNCRRYLVESTGDLLIVFRYCAEAVDMDGNIIHDMVMNEDENEDSSVSVTYRTVRFDVYKLERQQNKWSYIKSLGDRALFLGINHSFSLSSKDFPELRRNSIYFTDDDLDELRTEENSIGGHDLGIFNLEDNSVKPYYPGGNLQKITPPPIWLVPSPW